MNSILEPPAKQRLSLRERAGVTFAALRYRNYRLWFVGQSLSLMGTWMQNVAQSWLVFQLTGSELALGTISFMGSIPTLLLMLFSGALADRVSKRHLLMVTQTTMMTLAFIMTALTGTKVLQVWHIAVLAVGLGTANAFDAPARQSLAVEMVEDRRDLSNAIALNSMIFNLARVVGPAAAGLVLAALGAVWCFGLNGLSFLAVLIALSQMRLPNRAHARSREPLKTQIMAGLRYVWQSETVRTVIMVLGVASLFGNSYSVLMPAFAVDVLHQDEKGLGLLNACVGLGALVGSFTVATLGRFRAKGKLLTLGNLLLPLSLLVFAFSRSFVLSLAILVVVGWSFVLQNATANTLVQSLVPDELRGRVMSVYMLVFFGSFPLGSLQAGAIAQAWGPSAGVAIGATVALIFALVIFFTVPALRRVEVD